LPTYKYTVRFNAFENDRILADGLISIEDFLLYMLKGMGYNNINVQYNMIYDEGGTDELLKCKGCGRCGGQMKEMFDDGKCICQSCRDRDKDDKGRKEYEEYLINLDKKGLRYDDVLGEVPK
jgi:hypothetical protein